MAKPKRFPGLINTSPNSTGLGGSKTVAEAVKRARTSGLGGGSHHPSYLQSFPSGNPWDQRGTMSESGIAPPDYGQQRQDMMADIDAMMGPKPFFQFPGDGVPSTPNQYGPQGMQNHSVYDPGTMPNTGMSYGNPSMYGIGTESGNGPGAGMGGTYGQRPELPYEARAREEAEKNIPWVDGPNVDVGIGSSDPNLIGSIPWVEGPAGVDVGVGSDFPAHNYVPWDPAGNESDIGMGGDLFPQNTDFRGPSVPEGTRRQYAPSEDATRGDMGPLANNLERTTGDYDVSRKNQERMETKEAEAAKKLADEWAERYGLDDDAKKKEEEMIVEMQKIQNKQRIMYALAAFSGNQGLATMAGMVAQQDLAILEKKYGNETNQRMRDMQRSILFDKDGNYDPPESQEELYRALGSMGATPAEMDAISGQFDYSKDEAKGQNWWNEEQQRYEWTDTGKPPDNSGGWVESGDVKKTDTASSGTGTKGAQRDEIAILRNNVAKAESAYGVNSAEAQGAREYLDLTEQLYGITEDITDKDPFMSTTMIKAQWDAMLSTGKVYGQKGIDWESVNEKYGVPNGVLIEDAEDFAEFFKDYMKSVNNPVNPDELEPVGIDGSGTEVDPYIVTSQEELNAVGSNEWFIDGDGNAKQKA